ncbi:glycosyltransferase [Ectothiorhodospiraceae bacterium 2226]|nr:glycosyltransferase [Ectothiorhodospiraceae bacterium 2226]
MRIVFFYHSLVSDWNHGNAHFLRGVAGELLARGHDVRIYEPADAWSVRCLLKEHPAALDDFQAAYPRLRSLRYDPATLDLDVALDGADLVLVHEWNEHDLVARIGRHRARTRRYRLLFHDTHHRAVTDRRAMDAYDLRDYDGVLAFGQVLRDLYQDAGWTQHAWVWHEAADTRLFKPMPDVDKLGDVVWIGNWGDEERSAELAEYLLTPIWALRLRATVYGVRYPERARLALSAASIAYRGWLPNYCAPEVFARYRATVHVPRRPYARVLPGIPTIRPFEAMACGIPLVSAPWEDSEGLFRAGEDYLVAGNGNQMQAHLANLMADADLRHSLAANGLATIRARHTCAHRVDELLAIHAELIGKARRRASA